MDIIISRQRGKLRSTKNLIKLKVEKGDSKLVSLGRAQETECTAGRSPGNNTIPRNTEMKGENPWEMRIDFSSSVHPVITQAGIAVKPRGPHVFHNE